MRHYRSSGSEFLRFSLSPPHIATALALKKLCQDFLAFLILLLVEGEVRKSGEQVCAVATCSEGKGCPTLEM